jgi:hypothetical protein
MAFFISGARLDHQMFVGRREGVSKNQKPFVTITVSDAEGNVNQFSTSDVSNMNLCRGLVVGDYVDLTLVIAGGPQRQYAMIANAPNSVRVSVAAPSNSVDF